MMHEHGADWTNPCKTLRTLINIVSYENLYL